MKGEKEEKRGRVSEDGREFCERRESGRGKG